MSIVHQIQNIRFENDYMLLTVDNHELRINLAKVSSKLKSAPLSVRNDYKISPSGYGIHWPQLDEDLSINGLLSYIN